MVQNLKGFSESVLLVIACKGFCATNPSGPLCIVHGDSFGDIEEE